LQPAKRRRFRLPANFQGRRPADLNPTARSSRGARKPSTAADRAGEPP
jgi:hypothetical protein